MKVFNFLFVNLKDHKFIEYQDEYNKALWDFIENNEI